MELQKQVVSLELAKELKEDGYPQEGLFCWGYFIFSDKSKQLEIIPETRFTENEIEGHSTEKICVAPTVAELGEELPVGYVSNKYKFRMEPHGYRCRNVNNFNLEYKSNPQHYYWVVEADTEADARALMWLKLKKEGLL